MSYYGDIRLGDTIDVKFTTRRFSTGSPHTLAGSPAVAAYVGNGTTEITAGITLTVDFDSRTGLNNVRIVATSGNGFATATNVEIVITAGTVDSVSVVGEVVASFSIENRSAVMPTTAGRTLTIESDGMAHADLKEMLGVAQSVTDLKDFADDGYDPSTNKVQGVVLTDTLTTYTGNTPQTGDSFARLGAPAGASVSADIAAIEAQTDDIGSAGAGLTAVPWNSAWDAEVQSEVEDALIAHRLDELLNADSDIDGAAPPTVGSVFHELMSKTAGSFTFDQTTDSNEAIRDNMGTAQTGDSFARLGAPAGASVSADIAAIEAQTDDIGVAGAGLTGVPWNAAWDAEVQSEVDDALVARNLDKLILASGTADSGSTSTMVDAARTEGDADYWKGRIILFTSGNIAGQCAIITDFNQSTDTFTFAPPLTQAVAAQNYVILPGISVWDDTLAEHLISGSTGAALNAAGSAGDPWNTALPGAYGAGTAGKIVGDNLNATVGSRATQTSVDTIDDLLDTEVAAIKAKTDQLTFTTSNKVDATIQAAGDFAQGAADKVWSTATRTLTAFDASFKTGYALSAAGIQAIWDALTSALTTVGSIGKLLVDNINATISSRSSHSASDVWASGTRTLTSAANITSTGGTTVPQTGDSFARIGAPAGASVSADILVIDNLVDDLESRLTSTRAGYLDNLNALKVKKNSALANFCFKMVQSSDHVTPATGLTITAMRSLDGAAFTACANSASEISAGFYKINLAATDLNADVVTLKFTASGADQRDFVITTQP